MHGKVGTFNLQNLCDRPFSIPHIRLPDIEFSLLVASTPKQFVQSRVDLLNNSQTAVGAPNPDEAPFLQSRT